MSKYAQLDSTIINLKNKGMSDADIVSELNKAGWSNADINNSYKEINQTQNNANNIPNQANSNPIPKKKKKLKIFPALVFLLAIIGALYYFAPYLFSKAPYSEDNLTSGLLSKVSQIESSRNIFSFDLYVADRDEDAKPYNIQSSDVENLKEKYQRDYERVSAAPLINRSLNMYYRDNGGVFPANIQDIENPANFGFGLPSTDNLTKDPNTNEYYEYRRVDNSQNYELTITLETDEAVLYLSRMLENGLYDYEINGKKITFNKNNSFGLYMSSELPKSLYEELAGMTVYMPPETKISGSIFSEIEMNPESKIPANFSLGVQGEGDLGDVTYKFDMETLKAGDEYYFRLNNFPSILLMFVGPIEKGKWIRIDSDNGSYSLIPSIEDIESEISQFDNDAPDLAEIFIRIADQERLFSFKSQPRKEDKDGENLFRYELDIKHENFKRFYIKLIEELESDPDTEIYVDASAESLINFIESDKYPEVFDFYRDNLNFTLWVDNKGFPAAFETSMRVVPNDDNDILFDKQVMLVTQFKLENINKGFNIVAPDDYTTIDNVYNSAFSGDEAYGLQSADGPIGTARDRGEDAGKKANLSNLRATAELYYDDNGNSYAGVCNDPNASSNVSAAEGVCFDRSETGGGSAWAANTQLSDGTYFCVDNKGNAITTEMSTISNSNVSCE